VRQSNLLLVALSLIFGCQGGEPDNGTQTPDHLWADGPFEDLVHLRTIGDQDSFGSIDAVSLVSTRQIVILDAMNSRLRLFDTSGWFLSEFGTRGAGPGEFFSPVALGVSPDQEVLVLDRSNRRISVFDSGSDSLVLIQEVPVPFPASDFCFIGPRLFLAGNYENHLIHEVTSSGDILRSFGELVEKDPLLRAISGVGHLACSREAGAIAWVPRTIASFRVFSTEGDVILETAIPEYAETNYLTDGVSFRPELPPEGYTNETIGVHWLDGNTLLIQLGLPGVDVVVPDGRVVTLDGVWDSLPPRWPEVGFIFGDTLFASEANPYPLVEVYGVKKAERAKGS
jgi:hypothetical protein